MVLRLKIHFSSFLFSNFAKAITENLRPENEVRHADLPAINTQRGRDHGLPSYNSFRELAGLPKATRSDFSDFTTIPTDVQSRLAALYENNPDNVDLYVGAMHEIPTPGSVLGRTFTHILLEGFKRLRVGDRFWYERGERNTGFDLEQLTEIRKISLARVICDNTDDISSIQLRVFLRARASNPRRLCRNLPFINLRAWRQRRPLVRFSFMLLG